MQTLNMRLGVLALLVLMLAACRPAPAPEEPAPAAVEPVPEEPEPAAVEPVPEEPEPVGSNPGDGGGGSSTGSQANPNVAVPGGVEIITTGSRVLVPVGEPRWNIWFEAGSHKKADYTPVPFLRTGSSYSLFVHLSALRLEAKGAVTKEVGAAILEHLRASQSNSVDLQLLLLADPRYFNSPSGPTPMAEMSVDVARLRALTPEQLANPKPDDPLLDLGAASFSLSTTGKAGYASVGLSVWADGVPIGELSVEVCVAKQGRDTCDEEEVLSDGTHGADDVRVANQLSGRGIADAALHFIPLGEATMGVFRCNNCGWPDDRFLSWRLKKDETDLVEFLSSTIQPAFQNAARFDNTKAFSAAGSDLYRTFFYSGTPAASAAKKAFEAFVAAAAAAAGDGASSPSIFVRFLSRSGDPPLYGIPLALMRVPVGAGKQEFIGSQLRIEIPLRYQDYSSPAECVASWVLLVPPEDLQDAELSDARAPLNTWIEQLRASPSSGVVYEDIDEFRVWLEGSQATGNEEEPLPPTNTALAIVSHHEDGTLFFDQLAKVPSVNSSTIERLFGPTSVAIINACGTAAPGAVDFISEFNRSGIPTVIGTSTTADAAMAGAVLSTLLANVRSHEDDRTYTLGQALFETTRALQATYGPKVFIYSIFGNGHLRLCAGGPKSSADEFGR